MSAPTASEAFRRLIDCLEEAASAARQLAFLRGQGEWLKVDERIVLMRRLVIQLAENKEQSRIIQ